ncbi:Set1 complex component spp1 [Wallemia ichthyophaga EXF-994]|uniref:Set1 complex component spp1 n=1 Tax=Wallemia ichthyophaga (strain EXF-994 / CBS 113033) TaxID=1299270 RepID=R9AFP5_WALI9|nr:Set1 complex component spp1 [Wallemia ichthyophaga EXF-994]EOQ98865.1 Set1 complex component spp1 [Wallemia ichthyophaga EXF-994]
MDANDQDEQEVEYCICKSNGADNLPMILCEGCEMWYHLHCLGFQPGDDELIDVFVCPGCEEKTAQRTSWRRKCSREDCKHASRLPLSIYCSDACGIYLMSLKLRQVNIHPESLDDAAGKIGNYNNIPSVVFDGDGNKVSSVSLAAESKKEDCLSKLSKLANQIEEYTNQISLLIKQESYHQLAISRASTLSNHLLTLNQNTSPVKTKSRKGAPPPPKGYCGFDYRLLADDDEWPEFNSQDKARAHATRNGRR